MKPKCIFRAGIFILLTTLLPAKTLQQAYEDAAPGMGYERVILLTPNSIYSGGLTIENETVCIKGHGAIINLERDSILVLGDAKIEIEGCVIYNGDIGLSVLEEASAYIDHCTFYGNDIGIKFYSYQGKIEVVNTIIAFSHRYGFACRKEGEKILHYINCFQNRRGNFVEWCPG